MSPHRTRFRYHILGILLVLSFMVVACGSDDNEATAERQEVEAAVQPSTQATNTVAPTATPVPLPPAEPTRNEAEANGAEAAPPGPDQAAELKPDIGDITFAPGITPAYEPVDAGLFFNTGITEMHAIFTYSGMASDYTWERVWYLNDQEIGRVLEPWPGPTAGIFDYLVDNGGAPLPAGDWVLELYVNGTLQKIGVFIIEEAQN